MKKVNFIALIVFSVMIVGCYQKTASNNRPSQTPTKSSTVAENLSVAPTEQTIKKGDFSKAMNYFDSKKYVEAADELEEVVKNDAKNQQAYFYLGKSYQVLNKSDKAIEAYKKTIEIKPDYAEANFELGTVYRSKKDYEAAVPYLEKASKIKLTSVEYLMTLGDNYRDLKRCNYAVVPYGKVTGFDEKNTAALYGMGLCYIELKNRIAAAQQVRNLEQLDKNLAKKLSDQIPK